MEPEVVFLDLGFATGNDAHGNSDPKIFSQAFCTLKVNPHPKNWWFLLEDD